jgi:hypothetical protein
VGGWVGAGHTLQPGSAGVPKGVPGGKHRQCYWLPIFEGLHKYRGMALKVNQIATVTESTQVDCAGNWHPAKLQGHVTDTVTWFMTCLSVEHPGCAP